MPALGWRIRAGPPRSVRRHQALQGGSRLYAPRASIPLYPTPLPLQRGEEEKVEEDPAAAACCERRGHRVHAPLPVQPRCGALGKKGGKRGRRRGGPRCSAPPSLAARLAPGRGAGRERLPRTAAAAAGTGHVPRGSPLPALPLGSLSRHRPSVLFIIHFIYTPPPSPQITVIIIIILNY